MKAKDVLGKRIVAIRQTRFYDKSSASFVVELNNIELDDGTCISFTANETEMEPYVEASVRVNNQPRQGRR